MKKIQTRLNKLSKRQLQEICKRIGIKCPKRKRDIVNKLLQPLEVKYKMEKSREQKRREREEARKMEREKKREERQRLIEKWKQEGKDNVEIVELLLQMNISE